MDKLWAEQYQVERTVPLNQDYVDPTSDLLSGREEPPPSIPNKVTEIEDVNDGQTDDNQDAESTELPNQDDSGANNQPRREQANLKWNAKTQGPTENLKRTRFQTRQAENVEIADLVLEQKLSKWSLISAVFREPRRTQDIPRSLESSKSRRPKEMARSYSKGIR
jgi:hypothetical protein